jgi:hypothetical protein
MICPTGRVKYFFKKDWTLESALIGLAKFDFSRQRDAPDVDDGVDGAEKASFFRGLWRGIANTSIHVVLRP